MTQIDMQLAVFDEINFTTFFARKYVTGKLIKMTWILINNMSTPQKKQKKQTKKKHILKKYRKKCNRYLN